MNATNASEGSNITEPNARLTNEALWARTYAARNKEREALDELLELLLEVDRRRLHLERGFDSMFTFLEKGLGYDPGSAHRRLMTLRAIGKMPEIKAQLKDGNVTLSAVAMTENHLRQIGKTRAIPQEERRELFSAVKGRTKAEVELILAKNRQELGLAPERMPDRVLRLDTRRTELRFEVGPEFMESLTRLRELFFHRNPEAKMDELLLYALRTTLRKLDPKERHARRTERAIQKMGTLAPPSNPDLEKRPFPAAQPSVPRLFEEPTLPREPSLPLSTRRRAPEPTEDELLHHPAFVRLYGTTRPHLPAASRDAALQEAGHRCEFKDSLTGRPCGGAGTLELDHRIPLSRSGANTATNVQVLCWGHHRLKSERERNQQTKSISPALACDACGPSFGFRP